MMIISETEKKEDGRGSNQIIIRPTKLTNLTRTWALCNKPIVYISLDRITKQSFFLYNEGNNKLPSMFMV